MGSAFLFETKKKKKKIRQVVKLILNHDPIQRFQNKWKSVQDIYLGLLSHFCTSVSFPLQYKTDAFFFFNISLWMFGAMHVFIFNFPIE